MKISILAQDLGNNCLGRAYLLAKILQRKYDIEIIGPGANPVEGIWPPLKNDKSIEIKCIKVYSNKFKSYTQWGNWMKLIDGDVIYASKPLITSFGIGLLKKLKDKKPLILDIDDWEYGFAREYMKGNSVFQSMKYLFTSATHPFGRASYWNIVISEKLVRYADKITVSNRFLQKRFGGTIIPHGRDTDILTPNKFNKYKMREKYDIGQDKKVVMFYGTHRKYSGIEDLINAINDIRDKKVVLVLVGVENDLYGNKIVDLGRGLLKDRFIFFGPQPFERLPELLSTSDIISIPQRKCFATLGMLPAKVFDAMAMAKPIVASKVNDLPDILNGCGYLVEPGQPRQIADAIKFIINNYAGAENVGKMARSKCINEYSLNALERILTNIFEKYRLSDN